MNANIATIFVGISAVNQSDEKNAIAFAFRNAIHLLDIGFAHLGSTDDSAITEEVLKYLQSYERENNSKIIAAGIASTLVEVCPSLCSQLWLGCDVLPMVIPEANWTKKPWHEKRSDEQADSMARRCLMHFNTAMAPALQVGWHSAVEVDARGMIRMCTLKDYKSTCSRVSWDTMMLYADKLRAAGTKVAFFSATPQGGGVALMRHALVRLSRLLNLSVRWYVPKPRQAVFRITKNMHNILQGVAPPGQTVQKSEQESIIEWITDNAKRYWLSEGGPLCAPEKGGADIVIIDDPQMIGLIPLSKQFSPSRPVLFRSHIQMRSDLIAQTDSPQAKIWDFIWGFVKEADAFICHPIPSTVPRNVPRSRVAYLPATTDWLDGLNKRLNTWSTQYYRQVFNTSCYMERMAELQWPARKYIIQVARFDPAKAINTVIDSYAEFRRQFDHAGLDNPPQLVICGNGSVDDPDGTVVFQDALAHIQNRCASLKSDIIMVRLDPNDQLLNMIISHAHVVLQLSTAEGFEVKVSEGLHAGRPVIGTRVGGIPLQIKDTEDGYLVKPGDWNAVAGHLMNLFTDEKLYSSMSAAARAGLSDEVSTVGNAMAWYFLVHKFVSDGGMEGHGRWVNDVAREEAGQKYAEGENRLPRSFTEKVDEAR